jgi:hypothetical protein
MKKIISLLFLLTSCSFTNVQYDNNAYDKINHIRTVAQLGTNFCDNIAPIKNELWRDVYEFDNYQELNNPDLYAMSKKLLIMSNEFYYSKPSEEYCKLKLKEIEDSAYIIQTTIGMMK